jgi:hypothetical protein
MRISCKYLESPVAEKKIFCISELPLMYPGTGIQNILTSIVPGHAFQNTIEFYSTESRVSKCKPFQWTAIIPGHACQNTSHPDRLLLPQVTCFKMQAIPMDCYCPRSCASKYKPFHRFGASLSPRRRAANYQKKPTCSTQYFSTNSSQIDMILLDNLFMRCFSRGLHAWLEETRVTFFFFCFFLLLFLLLIFIFCRPIIWEMSPQPPTECALAFICIIEFPRNVSPL